MCVCACVCVYPLWSPAEGFLPVSSDSKLIWLLDQKYLGESVPDFFPRNHFMWRASRLLPDPVHCFSHDMFPDTFPCVVSAAGRVASSGEMQSPALTTYLRKHSDIRRRKWHTNDLHYSHNCSLTDYGSKTCFELELNSLSETQWSKLT